MRFALSVFFLAVVSVAHAQITFEKGYFIDNENQRVECLIRNLDWRNNPSAFDYKTTNGSTLIRAAISDVKEFGIGSNEKWIRANIKIDTSSMLKLTYNRQPSWKESTLFLKVLIEGEASLYHYAEEGLDRFFFSKARGPIEQLVYKRFLVSSIEAAYNKYYIMQLQANVSCEGKTVDTNLPYNEEALYKHFVAYNGCIGTGLPTSNYKQVKKPDLNLKAVAGFTMSRFTMVYNSGLFTSYNVDFGSQIGFRFGLESEVVLPYNKGKWALIVEPTYRSYNGTAMAGTQELKLDYSSIEIHGGIRHYFFLNESSKLFVNASFVFDFPMNAKIPVGPSLTFELTKSVNNCLGFGLQHKRFSIEGRYYSIRNALSTYPNVDNDFKSYSLVVGHKFY